MLEANKEMYSLQNADKYQWGSISGSLNIERTNFLKRHIIGPKVLDAGCGGGAYVDFFAGSGYEMIGVDKYDFFLKNASFRGYRGEFINADLNNRLPFADKTFDTTYCMDVLEHIDDRLAIVELARVTKKKLILMVPQQDQWMQKYGLVLFTYQDPTHLRYYTQESLQELANSVANRSVSIFRQQLIDFNWIAREMLCPDSRKPGFKKLYGWLFNFLLLRCRSKEINMNLAAVIDL